MNGLYGKYFVAGFLMVCVSGCATLPGYEQPEYHKPSGWYDDLDSEGQNSQKYEPEIKGITPELIRELNDADDKASKVMPLLPPENNGGHYRIGAGDLLAVIVYGHADITNPVGLTQQSDSSGRAVDANGNIFIPFAGVLHVAGLTTAEARTLVSDSLRNVINDPQVDVRVLQFRSQKVYITGDLSQPCTVPVTDVPLTIVDALRGCRSEAAGGNADSPAMNSVVLLRDSHSYPIDLLSLYRRGGGPVSLQNGDRLIVDNRFNRVFVIGEFKNQLTVPVSATIMTLADAMAAAGGLNLETANTGAIFVIRGFVATEPAKDGGIQTVVKPTMYHLDARSVGAMILADQFRLQPRDVIYAAPASLVNFNRALAQITPSVDALFRTVIIFDRNR